ncbi:GNAT family N-acetyltransferase [Dinoroseobacter sp. S124A]|uniref:GNAT family N-acetyltransferase n=1 Tax=Dinoroseobacter sp. S124A TaxID=3415128 RepID=UPI003C7CADD7
MSDLVLRDFRPEDAAAVAQVFFDAVHLGTGAHYTPEQQTAWAGAAPRPPEIWAARLSGQTCKLALQQGAVVGFMSLEPRGRIDLAYVAPQVAGRGVAWRLYQALEAEARRHGLSALHTEASLSARPFFERQGWQVDAAQEVVREGITLRNFRMSKPLKA